MTHDDLRADHDAWKRLPLRPGWIQRPSTYDPEWKGESHGCRLLVYDNLDNMATVLWEAHPPVGGAIVGDELDSRDFPTLEALLDEAMRLAEVAADKAARETP